MRTPSKATSAAREDVARLADAGILVSTALRLPFPHEYFRVSIGPAPVMRPFLTAMEGLTG